MFAALLRKKRATMMMKTRNSRLKFVKDNKLSYFVGSSGAYGNGLRQTNIKKQDIFIIFILL